MVTGKEEKEMVLVHTVHQILEEATRKNTQGAGRMI